MMFLNLFLQIDVPETMARTQLITATLITVNQQNEEAYVVKPEKHDEERESVLTGNPLLTSTTHPRLIIIPHQLESTLIVGTYDFACYVAVGEARFIFVPKGAKYVGRKFFKNGREVKEGNKNKKLSKDNDTHRFNQISRTPRINISTHFTSSAVGSLSPPPSPPPPLTPAPAVAPNTPAVCIVPYSLKSFGLLVLCISVDAHATAFI
jgi:hypothetical protein